MRSDINVDAAQGRLDQFWEGLRLRWGGDGRVRIWNVSLDVEQGFDDAEAVDAEDLVVAVGEFEGPSWRRAGHFLVRGACGPRGRELVGSWPDLDDAFLELGEGALLDEGPVGRVGGLVGGECPVLDLRGLASFDCGLGTDQVVGGDGDGLGGILFKQGTNLRRDVLAAERGMLYPTLEDHTVMHGCDGDV